MRKKIFYICIAVAVICGVILAVMIFRWFRQQELIRQVQECVEIPEEDEDRDGGKVDFDALAEINPDIYAWLWVPGTDINYPILQSSSDKAEDYYLNHNLDGSTGRPACIYTQKRNARDFSDPNTVVYGHNMRDGSMFHDLHAYEEANFLLEHPYIYVYTPEERIVYQIFAAYRYDDRLILDHYDDFQDRDVFAAYLEEILNQQNSLCNINRDVTVTAEDQIITLETCIGDYDYRYIVQGVRLDEMR